MKGGQSPRIYYSEDLLDVLENLDRPTADRQRNTGVAPAVN